MKIFEISLFGITFAPTYYALMYIIGLFVGAFFMKKFFSWKSAKHLDELFWYIGLGIIIGGRLGYVFLYNFHWYLEHLNEIFAIWKGGMSFHGGFIGVLLWVFLFCKRFGYKFFSITDYLAVITPVGLGLGRLGNYLNNELYGYGDYTWPFRMLVNDVYHFPSPLLEMLLEGVLLFTILSWVFFTTKWRFAEGKISGIFLVGYAVCRIIAECFRLPDAQVGYLFGTHFFTLGMLYSLPMFVVGLYLIFHKKYLEKDIVF